MLESAGSVILIDPYLSRNEEARPVSDFDAKGTWRRIIPGMFSHILISHGHFDHLMDIPPDRQGGPAQWSGAVPKAAETLFPCGPETGNQIPPGQTKDGWKAKAGEFFRTGLLQQTMSGLTSRFWPGPWSVWAGGLFQIYPLFKNYPCGPGP